MAKFNEKDMQLLAKHLIRLDNASWWLSNIIYTMEDFYNWNQTKKEFKDNYWITPFQADQLINKFIKYLEKF